MSNLNYTRIPPTIQLNDIIKAQNSIDQMMKVNPVFAGPRPLKMIAYDNEMVCNGIITASQPQPQSNILS